MWSCVAADERSLKEVSGAVHDPYFDPDEIQHDRDHQTVVIPFKQEGWRSGPQPEQRMMRESWRFREYAVAFFHGTLIVEHVREIERPEAWAHSGMLLGVDFDLSESQVRVCSIDCLRLTVDALAVRAVITDEVAGYVRRRVGKLTRIESDKPTF